MKVSIIVVAAIATALGLFELIELFLMLASVARGERDFKGAPLRKAKAPPPPGEFPRSAHRRHSAGDSAYL
jgi:hypothetical protein